MYIVASGNETRKTVVHGVFRSMHEEEEQVQKLRGWLQRAKRKTP